MEAAGHAIGPTWSLLFLVLTNIYSCIVLSICRFIFGMVSSPSERTIPTVAFSGEAKGVAYERWLEEICRGLVRADVRALKGGPLHCEMAMAELPHARLGMFTGSAIEFTARTDEPKPRLYLQMPETTSLQLVSGAQRLTVAPGGLALADAAVIGAQSAVMSDGSFRTIGVERRGLLALCPDAEDQIAQPLDVAPGLASLIRHYHACALEMWPTASPAAQLTMSQHVIDLTALALGGSRDALELPRNRGLAAARLAAIKADIAANLTEPDLSVATIAARHRITPRYLHMLFEADGFTFSEFVLDRRLSRAHSMLSAPQFSDRPISHVALRCGFGDLSYFNRTFRRRYGLTPSDIRRMNRKG